MMSSDFPEINLNFVSPGTGEKSVVTIPTGATPADMIKKLFEVTDIYAELEIPDHTLSVLSPELVVPICSGYAVLHRTNLTLDFLDEEEVPIQRSELTQTQANIASGLLVNANNAIPVIDIYRFIHPDIPEDFRLGNSQKELVGTHMSNIRVRVGSYSGHFVNVPRSGYGFFTSLGSK